MRLNTCPNHPGLVIEAHPCPVCGHPARPPQDRPPFRARPLRTKVEENNEGAHQPTKRLLATISGQELEAELGSPEAEALIEAAAREARDECERGAIACPEQPTLDDVMFPAVDRSQVPMVKVAFTGTVEMTQAEWAAYCREGVEPGRVVKVTLTGYLPDPHARWVKRTAKDPLGDRETWWEQEGVIKVKVLELGGFELRGIYDGE